LPSVTPVISYSTGDIFAIQLQGLVKSHLVKEIIILSPKGIDPPAPKCRVVEAHSLKSGDILNRIISELSTDFFLLILDDRYSLIEPRALENMLNEATASNSGIVFSDFYIRGEKGLVHHPLCDYMKGSVRDDFDFGGMMLFSTSAVRDVMDKYGNIPDVKFAGLYDLRLKVSIDHPILHIKKPLYYVIYKDLDFNNHHFAYLDPKNRSVQIEMESIFTNYLRLINAYIPHWQLKNVKRCDSFPVEASVIIPVKNRVNTIGDAISSALSQKTDFSYNIIVVDNHSTDGTTKLLTELAKKYPSIKHIVPEKKDLGIGGCWNEAINSPYCGRYIAQLDSDDLYSSPEALSKMVNLLRDGKFAMVIGSYTVVDFHLREIPPGLIDHREWTDENGHNNALRINGLGAPRAFDNAIIKGIGFLNVSYGEDYAAALRICRVFKIGRIFEGIYLCRRWKGNTDANLPQEQINKNNEFKDSIRTGEILARQKINRDRMFKDGTGP